jgi:hypothetical protein
LRSTSRFGFAGVTNSLKSKLNHRRLFEVALVVASWRVVLHCCRGNAPYPLRLACCARGRVVLYRSRGRPQNPLLRCAWSHCCAWLCCTRKRPVCIVVGGDPRTLSLSISLSLSLSLSLSRSLSLLFAHTPALRDIHEAPHHVAVLKNPPACDASRLRRLECSRVALLFWGAWPTESPAGARPVECSALSNKRFS